ncbi:MAG: hypothetical protein ACRDJE_24880 [Dehalococcoidia bacterium]
MTDEQTLSLVLKDEAGNYFLVPQELLEQGRVPEEHTAEIERLIAEQQDVQGYARHDGGGWGGPESIGWQVARVFWRIGWTAPPILHL